jgi:hypothetical protein
MGELALRKAAVRKAGTRRKDQADEGSAPPVPDDSPLQAVSVRLDYMIRQITAGEFHWQDANYDRDSVLGRELLFLIANNDWVRATSEIVDIVRSDAIETTIDIDVDLSHITHEAFRGRAAGPIWLPIVVLPPLRPQLRQPLPDPEPFSTLRVTDGSGSPLMTLPRADVRHRVAAALTDIILDVAAARQADLREQGPTVSVTRDHRLVMSAAIYRLLRGETVPELVLTHRVPPRESAQEPMRRIDGARKDLGVLLAPFWGLLSQAVPAEQEQRSAARQLTERANQVLMAFTESTVVVIPAERNQAPTVLTVKLPGRALHSARAPWALIFGPDASPAQALASAPVLWWLRPSNWVFPSASLHLDMLLPAADADRQIRVNLPDGVSPHPAWPLARRAELDIRCEQPLPIGQLATVTPQLVTAGKDWPGPFHQSLADLAGSKADAAWAALRDHHVGASPNEPPLGTERAVTETRTFRLNLDHLGTALRDIAAHGPSQERRTALTTAWNGGDWLTVPIQRRTSTDTVSPGMVAARSRAIQDTTQRAAPTSARMEVQLAVTDSSYFSTALLSGWINTLLMLVVLAFFSGSDARIFKAHQVSAEVLALVLTLFVAIQLGRIERSDRTSLRGVLAPMGLPLIIGPIVPSVLLAGAIAFSRSAPWAPAWAGGCILLQLALLWTMVRLRNRALRRGLLSEESSHPKASLMFFTDPPDYTHSEVIHSNWWRRTTAEAIVTGRPAHGYVVYQHGEPQSLRSLLRSAEPAAMPVSERLQGQWLSDWRHIRSLPVRRNHGSHAEPGTGPAVDGEGSRASDPDASRRAGDGDLAPGGASPFEQLANVLALQRSGTGSQLLNFAVFRDQPKADWAGGQHNAIPVAFDSNQLTPAEDAASTIGVFVGLPAGQEKAVSTHPITEVLRRAAPLGLVVREIQLPIPAPTASLPDLQWARIHFNVRTEELKRVKSFLDSLRDLAFPPGAKSSATSPVVIGVQARPEGTARILNPAAAASRATTPAGHSPLVLASDLDVVTRTGAHQHESATAKSWRAMAICADWRVGIEGKVLAMLDGDLTLIGLTAAILHGKSVMLLLGHRADGKSDGDHDGLHPAVRFDQWLCRQELGTAPGYPLLRVHMRTPDRPGATLDVLESLREAIKEILPDVLATHDWLVWYARSVVKDGNMAHVQLTIMLPVDHDGHSRDTNPANKWNSSDFSLIERRTLAYLAARMAETQQPSELSEEAPPETIVRVGLVKVPDPIQGA